MKPTIFLGVPRVWEKIAEKIKAVGARVTGFKKKIATWAKAKGLADRDVVLKHGLRNAMLPVVTVVGLQFGSLLSGDAIDNLHASGFIGSVLGAVLVLVAVKSTSQRLFVLPTGRGRRGLPAAPAPPGASHR